MSSQASCNGPVCCSLRNFAWCVLLSFETFKVPSKCRTTYKGLKGIGNGVVDKKLIKKRQSRIMILFNNELKYHRVKHILVLSVEIDILCNPSSFI